MSAVPRETRRRASAKAAKSLAKRKAAGTGLPPQLERLAAQAIADGYGPGGHMCGTRAHEVMSVADVLARIEARMERNRQAAADEMEEMAA